MSHHYGFEWWPLSRATRLSHERLVDHGFSVLTPSRPGYDNTSNSVGKTAQDAADSLSELLDLLHIQSIHVIGISAAVTSEGEGFGGLKTWEAWNTAIEKAIETLQTEIRQPGIS